MADLGTSTHGPTGPNDTAVTDLVHALRTYRNRYARVEIPPEIDRLELAIGRRVNRMELLRNQVGELLDEISLLDEEIVGYRKGYLALLEDTVDRIRNEQGEGWSPTPVLGYRLWGWRENGIHGAWERWPSPRKTARCTAGNDEVPHSDRRCGRLGCGVYAAKELGPLLEEHTGPEAFGYLAGLVEMSGKVVEHEHGYRAARATVVAAVLVGKDDVLETTEPDTVAELFQSPDEAMERLGRPRTRPAWDSITELLAIDERRNPWTSETRSE